MVVDLLEAQRTRPGTGRIPIELGVKAVMARPCVHIRRNIAWGVTRFVTYVPINSETIVGIISQHLFFSAV